MTARGRHLLRALRAARRLMASDALDRMMDGIRLEARIVKAAQRSGAGFWYPTNLLRNARRAEYLGRMSDARRAGNRAAWERERAGLAIWGSSVYPWLWLP